ncbi:MAG: hypothetical protein IPL36_13155 [Nigerium sp.]|nr:hypothetical protein [Nigerium sp.]
METFAMASLVSTEVAQRTVTAVLVTPARVSDFLLRRRCSNDLSLGQALIVLALIGGMTSQNWSLLLTALLVGAVMFHRGRPVRGLGRQGLHGATVLGDALHDPPHPAVATLFPVRLPGGCRPSPPTRSSTSSWGPRCTAPPGPIRGARLAYAAIWLVVLFGAGWITLKRKVASL